MSWKAFPIRILLFLSYLFGIEAVNTFTRCRSSPENHTRFQTKMDKVYTLVYRPEKPIPIPFGAEHTYMTYIREYTPRGALGVTLKSQRTALTHPTKTTRPEWEIEKTAAWDLRSGTRRSSGKFTIIRLPVLSGANQMMGSWFFFYSYICHNCRTELI